jgi:methionine-rich copper-binding protein CopC
VGVVVLLVLAAVRGSAAAHGILLDSTPKASETAPEGIAFIALRFNARIESGLSKVRLTGPFGEDVRLADGPVKSSGSGRLTAALPPLTPGLHIMHWQIFTHDGHLSRGRFSPSRCVSDSDKG